MGSGTSGKPDYHKKAGDASTVLGRNNQVPSEEDIKLYRTATYGGLPVVYNAQQSAEASNWTTEIIVGTEADLF